MTNHQDRTYVVTGAASGIGAATTDYLRQRGGRVITCDLRAADVIADLSTCDGRASLADGVARLSGGKLDGVVANAGGGPAETMLALNFFGALATLEGLRTLLAASPAPRAVAISSVSSLGPVDAAVVEACLRLNEQAAVAAGRAAIAGDGGLTLYGSAKQALNRWCRRSAPTPPWAGEGIALNVIAPGVIDTPAADWILSDPDRRAQLAERAPLKGAYPGRPDQLAAAVAWCVGTHNALMTGQVLYVDAGIEVLARKEAL